MAHGEDAAERHEMAQLTELLSAQPGKGICSKVQYYLLPDYAFHSKAYLDRELPDGTCTGEDKYTDEPVRVRWNGDRWEQVSSDAS